MTLEFVKKTERRPVGNNGNKVTCALWLCSYCGAVVEREVGAGKTHQSCGCMRDRLAGSSNTKHGCAKKGRKTRLYRIWSSMKTRCSNPKAINFHRYGGRGISFTDEWVNFTPFKLWAESNGYTEDLTLDRVDNSRGYSPENCRWVTNAENCQNQRTTKLTQEKADEIRSAYALGQMNQYELANKYGVSQATTSRIILNKSWVR